MVQNCHNTDGRRATKFECIYICPLSKVMTNGRKFMNMKCETYFPYDSWFLSSLALVDAPSHSENGFVICFSLWVSTTLLNRATFSERSLSLQFRNPCEHIHTYFTRQGLRITNFLRVSSLSFFFSFNLIFLCRFLHLDLFIFLFISHSPSLFLSATLFLVYILVFFV